MFIVGIILLAILLFWLIRRPRPPRESAIFPPQRIDAYTDSGIIFGETPDGTWQGGTLPDDFRAGSGDFGGGGSSASWSDDTSDASGGDGGGDGGSGGD